MTHLDLLRAIAFQAVEAERAGQGSPEPITAVPVMDAGALYELVASLERRSMELDRTLILCRKLPMTRNWTPDATGIVPAST
jgi:hypothetical protein